VSGGAREITFYFDFLSPYAYIAWTQVHALAARAPQPRGVTVVPVLLGAILDAMGQKGPAEIPAKRLYAFKDAYRKARALGLPPLVLPPTHPFNPLVALRVASLARWGGDETSRRRAVDELFAAAWRDGVGIETKEDVAAVLARAGFDGASLVEESQTPDAKERLRAQTAAAIAVGVFGVPTLLVDGEIFWGVDSLAFAEAKLRGEDPAPTDTSTLERPASATRRTQKVG
jgi:2-hydroxychromene-2-carboxylate isomerase